MSFWTPFVAASVSFFVNHDNFWQVRLGIIFFRNSTASTW